MPEPRGRRRRATTRRGRLAGPPAFRRVAQRRTQSTGTRAPIAADGQDTTRSLAASLVLCVLVFVQYGLLALDIRFVAVKNYAGIVVVNSCIALNTWYLTRRIVEARTLRDRAFYMVGGTTGALVAVWAS